MDPHFGSYPQTFNQHFSGFPYQQHYLNNNNNNNNNHHDINNNFPLNMNEHTTQAPTNHNSMEVENTHMQRNPAESPLYKLSVNLFHTYKQINDNYITNRKKQKEEQVKYTINTWDDEKGDYIIQIGQSFGGNQYTIKGILGKGSFGQVIQAHDRVTNEDVAIKIIKNKQSFYNQAVIEIQLLEHLKKNDPHDKFGVVQLKRYFIYREHLCLVFELLTIELQMKT